jgi:DNA-binding MarR family transcriptional regulator
MRSIFTLDESDPAIELTVAQLRVCSILDDGRLTVSGLARELGTSVSAATQIADRLESSGLIQRSVGKDDRRTRRLQLTRRGRELLRARTSRRLDRARKVLLELSPATRIRLLGALHALLEAGVGASESHRACANLDQLRLRR